MSEIRTVLARLLRQWSIPTFTVFCLMIEASPAQQQPTPEVLEYKGIVAAAREVEIAPRLDGLLSKINFAAGQVVKKGDLLFEFASKSNELSLALAQATLKQAEAQLGLAEVNLKNKQTLRARNVGSEMEGHFAVEFQCPLLEAKQTYSKDLI